MATLHKPASFNYEMHHGAKTQIIQSRDTYKKFWTARNHVIEQEFLSVHELAIENQIVKDKEFCFLGPYNKTLNFHWSIKKHEIEKKVLLTEIMQSTFTNIPTFFFFFPLCKVYALSLLYMHKNIYTYIPVLPSFPSPSPTILT